MKQNAENPLEMMKYGFSERIKLKHLQESDSREIFAQGVSWRMSQFLWLCREGRVSHREEDAE